MQFCTFCAHRFIWFPAVFICTQSQLTHTVLCMYIQSLYNKIKNGSYYFKSSSWKDLSVQAVDLVKRLLVVPQMDRLTVQEALAHPWFHLQPGMHYMNIMFLCVYIVRVAQICAN